MPFVPDAPAKKRASSFVPDAPVKERASSFVPDATPEKPKTPGLFGTRIGENDPLLGLLRKPAALSREGFAKTGELLHSINPKIPARLSDIPDAEGTSVVGNFLSNLVRRDAADIFLRTSADMIEPEAGILGAAGVLGKQALGTSIGKAAVDKAASAIPAPIKRIFTYRFGQPKTYQEMAEAAHGEMQVAGEKAIEVGKILSAGLSQEEKLTLGQLLRGEITPEGIPGKLVDIARQARATITETGESAVRENLLKQDTFLHNMEKYVPRLYRLFEESKNKGQTFAEFFGSKPARIIGKRFLKRDDIPEDVRRQLGEILEPAYPVARGIAQVGHDVAQAKLFRNVAANAEWVSKEAREGFVQMAGDSKKLGDLAGKWVHPEIARDINDIAGLQKPGGWQRDLNAIFEELPALDPKNWTQLWKAGKTVMNPATHGRNMFFNSILMDLGGTDLTRQPRLLAQAAKEMFQKGKYFAEAKAANLLGHEFAATEISKLLDNGLPVPGASKVAEFLNPFKSSALKKMGEVYQAEEQLFKLAKFIDEREKGLAVKEAVEQAEKWLFNYQKVSPFVQRMRSSPIGAPFLTFTVKAIPRLAEAAVTNPLRLYKYAVAAQEFENISKERLGRSEKEFGQIERGKFGPGVMLPNTDKAGNPQVLDLSNVIPDLPGMEERGTAFGVVPPSLVPLGIAKPLIELMANKSFFTEKPIYKKTDEKSEKIKKISDYLYKAWLPSFAPAVPGVTRGGYSYDKVVSAAKERPDYFGRERDLPTTLADVLTGTKIYPVTPEIVERFEQSDIKKEGQEIKGSLKSFLMDARRTKEEKEAFKLKSENKLKKLKEKARAMGY